MSMLMGDSRAEPFPDEIAKLMLEEASVKRSSSIFAATGHSRNNISVAHQQVRSTNLAWALIQVGKVTHGSVVAIVGGGISALMLSVALAVQKRCIVYIIEKERRLLHNFRQSPYRFLSPNLNTRDLPTGYDPETAYSFVEDLPFFKWKADLANEVAHQWLREFQGYAKSLPIFVLESTEVVECTGTPDGGVAIKAKVDDREVSLDADLAILATGFGEEQNPFGVDDWSYWQSGSPLQYRPGRKTGQRPRVVIAGCGDSGVVELMHHVFKDFRHELLPRIYPRGVEMHIQNSLDTSTFRNLRDERQDDEFDDLISELGWFYNCKYLREANPGLSRSIIEQGGSVEQEERQILHLLARITDELERVGVPASNNMQEPDTQVNLTEALKVLPAEFQHDIRASIDSDIATLASIEINGFMKQLDLKPFLGEFAPGVVQNAFDIVLVNSTPTPYTEKLSPINLAYLKLCHDAQSLGYRQGKLIDVEETATGFLVHLDNGDPVHCDRVATRFGVHFSAANKALLGTGTGRHHHGDMLLTPPEFLVNGRYVNHATEGLKVALNAFRKRSSSPNDGLRAPKSLIMAALLLPEGMHLPDTADGITLDVQVLKEAVIRGTSVNYEDLSGRSI